MASTDSDEAPDLNTRIATVVNDFMTELDLYWRDEALKHYNDWHSENASERGRKLREAILTDADVDIIKNRQLDSDFDGVSVSEPLRLFRWEVWDRRAGSDIHDKVQAPFMCDAYSIGYGYPSLNDVNFLRETPSGLSFYSAGMTRLLKFCSSSRIANKPLVEVLMQNVKAATAELKARRVITTDNGSGAGAGIGGSDL